MRTLKGAIAYFAFVFGAGFALGIMRVLWVVPRFGARRSELMEMPIMLVAIIGAARWVVRRLAVPTTLLDRLGMGILGLGLLLAAEFGLVLWVLDLSISEYSTSRDPVSRAAYYVMLGVFAIMPMLVARGRYESHFRSP